MHVGSRALPRRPIRVHAALAGRLAGRLADWRLAVVAVPADVSQWVSARGAAGRRARVCRHTDSKHGVCPRAHVWGARRTRRRSSELGAGDDSRDTAGRLRTTRGFIRVCAKNHSRGMHAARGITVIARSKSKTWTEHGTLHRRDRVATRSKDSAPHRCATWCAMRRVGEAQAARAAGLLSFRTTEHQNESTPRLDIWSRGKAACAGTRSLLCQICLLAGRVNNQRRLGWGEGSPGKLGTIAGEARYRHQPGDTRVGSAHPKGGGRARPEPPICAQSAFSLAPRRAGPVSCPRTAAAF